MNDVICPYCSYTQEICHDDGYGVEEDIPHQQECPVCDKTFVYWTYISLNYRIYEADCLNGEEHDFQRTHTSPPEAARLECIMCGEEKPFKINEKNQTNELKLVT